MFRTCYSFLYKIIFNDLGISVSTARAGNVIGGGDFANDRIIPDCVRAAMSNNDIVIRNPYSTRPYQHGFRAIICLSNDCRKTIWEILNFKDITM